MQDSLAHFAGRARERSSILDRLGVAPDTYYVATVHRAELTDDPARLRALLEVLDGIDAPVLLPLHPRTRARLETGGHGVWRPAANLRLIEPLGYLDMLRLVASARRVLTDSGGLQKEAYWLARPCVTLRAETEWIETVESGWNTLVETDARRIHAALDAPAPIARPSLYGDGRTAEKIVAALGRETVAACR